MPSYKIKFWSLVPPLTLMLEMRSSTLIIPGRFCTICKTSGSIRPGKILNALVSTSIVPLLVLEIPLVR